MSKFLALGALAALMFCIPAATNAVELIEFNTWSKGPGQLYQNKISESELQKTPSWSPEEVAPPLSIKKAVELAKAYIKKKSPEFNDYVITEIKLEQFVFPKYFKDKWCYVLIFMKVPEKCCVPESMNVLVMMDGTINEPEILKY